MNKICEGESYNDTMAYNIFDALTLESEKAKLGGRRGTFVWYKTGLKSDLNIRGSRKLVVLLRTSNQ